MFTARVCVCKCGHFQFRLQFGGLRSDATAIKSASWRSRAWQPVCCHLHESLNPTAEPKTSASKLCPALHSADSAAFTVDPVPCIASTQVAQSRKDLGSLVETTGQAEPTGSTHNLKLANTLSPGLWVTEKQMACSRSPLKPQIADNTYHSLQVLKYVHMQNWRPCPLAETLELSTVR